MPTFQPSAVPTTISGTHESNPAPGFVDMATLESERAAIAVVADLHAGMYEFPYGRLSAHGFEILLYTLFRLSTPPKPLPKDYDTVRLMNEGADEGRDVVLYKDGKSAGVIQCKRRDDNIGLPEVFREIIRLILFSTLYPHLISPGPGFNYILALSGTPSKPAGDLFAEPSRVIQDNDGKLPDYVQQVLDEYESFVNIVCADVLPIVRQKLGDMTLRLLTHTDLNQWLHNAPSVANLFFSARLVIDADGITKKLLPSIATQAADEAEKSSSADLARWLDTLSRAAKRSAIVISTTMLGQKKPMTLDTVYVTRTIEQSVNKWLADLCLTGGIIALIGPAGYGKSSLLSRLQCKLADQYAYGRGCIVFPATEVVRFMASAEFDQRTGKLADHIRERATRGLPTHVLFDTFDVLVHDATIKETALSLIDMLVQSGATVLLSSRPEEIGQIPLESIATHCVRLYLEKYDLDEFTQAARRYCAAFYAEQADGKQITQHVEKLVTAVTKNRPIREVCLGPLTLRMLFELYAPSAIPEHATAFNLYGRYWTEKVQRDARSGGMDKAYRDLSHIVMALAEKMVGSGAPSLTLQQVHQLVAIRSLEGDGIAELRNRNVLVDGPSNSVAFFHQTLFEYAAASAMARRTNYDVKAIKEAILADKDNNFLLPVYEQALLICAETDNSSRSELALLASEFIQIDHPALVSCAMYLHMYSSDGVQSVVDHLINSIREGNKPLLRRYVQFLTNLRQNRVGEVVEILKASWHTSVWEFVEPALHLLVWLARNDWDTCQRLVDELRLSTRVFSLAPTSAPVERLFIDIVEQGVEVAPAWVGDQLLGLKLSAASDPLILNFLASHPIVMETWESAKVNSLADRLYRSYSGVRDEQRLHPAARLIVIAWSFRKIAQPLDITAIRNIAAERLPLTLRALAEPDHDLGARFLEELELEVIGLDHSGRWYIWLNFFFYPVLINAGANPAKQAAIMRACTRLFDLIATSDSMGAPNLVVAKFFQRLFIGGVAIDPLLDKMRSVDPGHWLSSSGLISLLPVALYLDIPAAVATVHKLCVEPALHLISLRRLIGALNSSLQWMGELEKPEFSEVLLNTSLDLALAANNASALLKCLRFGIKQVGSEHIRRALAPNAEKLAQLKGVLLKQARDASKLSAYELLGLLMELGALPALKIEVILALIAHEMDANKKIRAAMLLVHAQAGELDQALAMILDIGISLPVTRQRRIIEALHAILIPDQAIPSSPILARIATFSFGCIDNEPRAHLLGKIVFAYCRTKDYAAAQDIALCLIRNDEINAFGPTQKRTLAHHLDKTFQQLFNGLEPEGVALFIEELRNIDHHLGRLIVVALCKCVRADLNAHLESILALKKLSGDLKRVIQEYRRFGLIKSPTAGMGI